ncbi:hypothetical protein Tco_0784996, partial [Tanacetum coccineum]
VEGYTEELVHKFEQRLEMIFGRQVNRVHTLDYEGLTPDMRQDLAERLRMVYTRDDGQDICVSHAWRRLFEIRAPLVQELILKFFSICRISSEMGLDVADTLDSATGTLSGGRAVPGLSVVTRELPLIEMGELVKLNICTEVGDDWSWVAQGVERQPIAMAAAPRDAEDAPDVDEGAQVVPTPIHAPPPPPAAAGRTMPQRLGRLGEEIQGLRQYVRSLQGLVERSMTDQGRFSTWMDLAAKKSTKLVKYLQSGNLEDDWEVDRYGNANSVITEYLVNISKRRVFWSLNEDILKINDSDYQYAVSIKEDMAKISYVVSTPRNSNTPLTQPDSISDELVIAEMAKVEGYTEELVHKFEQRLEMIFGRQVNRVHTLDYEGLTPDMRQDLAERLRMVYTRDDGQDICVSHAWRRLFEIRAPLVQELILKFFSICRISSEMGFAYCLGDGKRADLRHTGWDFLRSAPSYTYIRDLVQSMDQGAANVSYLLARYLFRHAKWRKSGLSVVTRELPLIEMGELVKLNIYTEVGDDWSWVAQGMERQPIAMVAAPRDAEDAPDVDEGAQVVPTPIHAPPPPPTAAGRTMPKRLGRLGEEIQGLR